MDIQAGDYTLRNLEQINVVLGKNGCGKSTLLKRFDEQLASNPEQYGSIKYITPERGGVLVYEPSVELSSINDVRWLSNSRRQNQFNQFRQQTVAQYRSLETEILRGIEQAYASGMQGAPTFDQILEQINALLDNIRIERVAESVTFKIFSKTTNEELTGNVISSGESELVSLSIECLAFAQTLQPGKINMLLLDEPDVHLHPDLQGRLTRFMTGLVETHGFTVLIATHSTALLGDLADSNVAAIALMKSGDKDLTLQRIDDVYRRILPVFGAHPLSNIFNEAPLLLVEGEDDLRIWQQAVRTSTGRIRLFPVDCGGVSEMGGYEDLTIEIVNAVYDNAKAYSLRDRDEGEEEINDRLPLIRMRFHCRAAENLMLSDDVLTSAGTDWATVEAKVNQWLDKTPEHPKRAVMQAFKDGGFDRRGFDLKEIRILLVGEMIASNKPWEVLVGQAIGTCAPSANEHSLASYLGEKVRTNLLGL